MEKILIFDIETAADLEAVASLPEPKAPGNLKDLAKIAAAIEEKKAEQAAMAALDPDTATITAIGLAVLDVRYPAHDPERICAYLVGDEETPTESVLLEKIWAALSETGGRACGYNIIGFDFPVIMRRSFALGVKPVGYGRITLAKYRTDPILDLMGVLYNWNISRGLKWVCKRYGIPNPLPDLNGAMTAGMDRDTLRQYVANDVNMTAQLYRRMQGIYF